MKNRDRSLYRRIVDEPAGHIAEHCGSLARRLGVEASPRLPVAAPEKRSPCQAGDQTQDPFRIAAAGAATRPGMNMVSV